MTTGNAASKATRPIQRLAYASTVTCAAQASVYGKCVAATYTDVSKDICRAEFLKFKECLRDAMKKR
ncbi:hypothetical protein CC1G_04553 [Coprinopsis cinerea okayama7|uniref:Uncharacterized protein n=1 Tax=Coprinopsis cinerea (strain Okayama-7 / 130 / ATCC MYA-4618 / FGSC 9003) TaxID=240176 RepID=A8N5H5_COPC7|nr:hypothetical protein CC1G_04553 [Coprinopsis cinerea okayama7\|eukprot:XP_001830120.1 hypothetical protein CC1G_04553 [Coprinopsis cinerea okayama7\